MLLYGFAHRVGDAVTTAQIIAPAHRDDDPATLAAHCLETLDPALPERVRPGDFLLAGHGFGAGDDPETAVLALQALGVAAVLCDSAEPGFVAAAEPYGLPVLAAPEAAAGLSEGVLVRLDLGQGRASSRDGGQSFALPACPPALLAALARAQILARMRQVVEEEGFDG